MGGSLCKGGATKVVPANNWRMHPQKSTLEVLEACQNNNSSIRYHAFKDLCNILENPQEYIFRYIKQIFHELCTHILDPDEEIRKVVLVACEALQQRMHKYTSFRISHLVKVMTPFLIIEDPSVRIFLLSLIDAIWEHPESRKMPHIHDFLDGLLDFLSDSHSEVRENTVLVLGKFLKDAENSNTLLEKISDHVHAALKYVDPVQVAQVLVKKASSPDGLTRLTVITWINQFVRLGGEALLPNYASILEVILLSISDKDEKIQLVASQANNEIESIWISKVRCSNVEAILDVLKQVLSSKEEKTQLQALYWIETILNFDRDQVLPLEKDICDTLLEYLDHPSTEVSVLVLKLLTSRGDVQNFKLLVAAIVNTFRANIQLLDNCGFTVISQLCVSNGAERVFRELASVLKQDDNLEFSHAMIQVSNMVLLRSPDLRDMRALLMDSTSNSASKDLFSTLYSTWCHSPAAAIGLCLLSEAYKLADALVHDLSEIHLDDKFFVEMEGLIELLESPTFINLRLQLLKAKRHACLVKALRGILAVLPVKSEAFKILQARLMSIHAGLHEAKEFSSLNQELDGLWDKGLKHQNGSEEQ